MTKAEIAHLHDCVESLKKAVADNAVVIDQIKAILDSFRILGAVAKWLAAIITAGVAIYHAVTWWKG